MSEVALPPGLKPPPGLALPKAKPEASSTNTTEQPGKAKRPPTTTDIVARASEAKAELAKQKQEQAAGKKRMRPARVQVCLTDKSYVSWLLTVDRLSVTMVMRNTKVCITYGTINFVATETSNGYAGRQN